MNRKAKKREPSLFETDPVRWFNALLNIKKDEAVIRRFTAPQPPKEAEDAQS